MCLEDHQTTLVNARESFSAAPSKCSVEGTIRTVLREAQMEKRLTVGLLPAIQCLSSGSDTALFCLLAPARPGDSAHHMQEVLLEAFCLENDIYIVKVDSAEKLHNFIPSYCIRDCCCILVHHAYSDPFSDDSPPLSIDRLSPTDKQLAEHCDMMWGMQPTPIIRLPEQ